MTTIYTQDYDKVAEIKVETPYEKRQREFAESRGETYKPAEEKKEKSAEDIESERAALAKKMRLQFQETVDAEASVLSHTINRLY